MEIHQDSCKNQNVVLHKAIKVPKQDTRCNDTNCQWQTMFNLATFPRCYKAGSYYLLYTIFTFNVNFQNIFLL